MEISDLLNQGRQIWGKQKLTLSQIIVRMGKVFGDICRWERNASKDNKTHTKQELQKEMGNMILSSVRWCDDLGFDPEKCIEEALKAQKKFKK
ncbi:MAG TPA: hypothetical protein P5548_04030 [Candidatus Moranbacteria bacterium]|nr:hypothetical protein [Candidatus Moranbacteria bacterium]